MAVRPWQDRAAHIPSRADICCGIDEDVSDARCGVRGVWFLLVLPFRLFPIFKQRR